MTSPDAKADKMDFDTLIREAEARVVAADRLWQRHGDELAVVLQRHAGTAGKVGKWGGVGVAVTAVAAGLWRWRAASRARAQAKTVAGRAKGMAQGLAASVAAKASSWAGRPVQPVQVPVRPASSTFWEAVITTAGLLLGAAARTGLKSSSRTGVAPLLFSAALPVLSRWWRSRQQPPR